MAAIFSKNSGLNDDFWKDDARALAQVIDDTANEKGQYDELVSAIYNEKTSKKYAEKTAGLTALGNMTPTSEGDNFALDSIQEAEPKLIVHSTFTTGFACTQEMKEDGEIEVMKAAARNLALSYKRTRAQIASDALTCAASSFVFGGKTFDATTGDGVALFSTSHAGSQSNVYTNDFGNNSTMLNRLANIGRNFKNASGHVQGYTFDTIIIPSNCPALEDTIKRIIRSDLVVGSNNNDVNTQKGLWNLIVDPCWQVASGNPYIIMSKEANKALLAAMFYDRVPLTIRNDINKDNWNLEWTARARFTPGFRDFRAFIMGGAAAGTTLS